MQAIAPNLTVLVGELVGARLIAHAGSLLNLAKHPASTVQILGAEKALFRYPLPLSWTLYVVLMPNSVRCCQQHLGKWWNHVVIIVDFIRHQLSSMTRFSVVAWPSHEQTGHICLAN